MENQPQSQSSAGDPTGWHCGWGGRERGKFGKFSHSGSDR